MDYLTKSYSSESVNPFPRLRLHGNTGIRLYGHTKYEL